MEEPEQDYDSCIVYGKMSVSLSCIILTFCFRKPYYECVRVVNECNDEGDQHYEDVTDYYGRSYGKASGHVSLE